MRPVAITMALALLGPAAPMAEAQYSSDRRFDPNRAHPTQVILDLQMLSPERRVDTAMALFRGFGQSDPKIATQILLAQRAELVVPRIIDAISLDVLFEEPDRRRYAFIVLAAKQEWPHPGTYEILTLGLIDWRVHDVCRTALEQAPLERRGDAALQMASRMENWYINHGPATGELLEIVGSYGGTGSPALDMVKRIYLSPTDRWHENRITAAKALAQIGGLPLALESYRQMDTIQYKGALAGLTWLGQLVPSPFTQDPRGGQLARAIVLDALDSPSVGVIQAAFEAVPAVYGDALYVQVDGVTQLNPGLKKALIASAESQGNPTLRSALVTTLRQYEAAAAGQ